MKYIAIVFAFLGLLLLPAMSVAQVNPFRNLTYDKVLAYEFQGEGGRVIEECLKQDRSRISKSVQLNEKQISDFENLITANSSYGATVASCFDPHFAIVYFKGDQIIATIDVCLDCNYLLSSKKIPATSFQYIKVSDDYSYPANGFSKQARKAIDEFCRSLGFVQYLKPLTSVHDQ